MPLIDPRGLIKCAMGIDEDAGIREALEQGLGQWSSQQHCSKERELNMNRGDARTNNQVYWWKKKWESGLAWVETCQTANPTTGSNGNCKAIAEYHQVSFSWIIGGIVQVDSATN